MRLESLLNAVQSLLDTKHTQTKSEQYGLNGYTQFNNLHEKATEMGQFVTRLNHVDSQLVYQECRNFRQSAEVAAEYGQKLLQNGAFNPTAEGTEKLKLLERQIKVLTQEGDRIFNFIQKLGRVRGSADTEQKMVELTKCLRVLEESRATLEGIVVAGKQQTAATEMVKASPAK